MALRLCPRNPLAGQIEILALALKRDGETNLLIGRKRQLQAQLVRRSAQRVSASWCSNNPPGRMNSSSPVGGTVDSLCITNWR